MRSFQPSTGADSDEEKQGWILEPVDKIKSAKMIAFDQERKTAQLIFAGGFLALLGLWISLLILGFRAHCDAEGHVMGMYVNLSGDRVICKNDWKSTIVDSIDRETYFVNGLQVDVPGTSCHVDSDCQGTSGTFCAVPNNGKHKTVATVAGHCQESNSCICADIIYNCGLALSFEFQQNATDMVVDCTSPRKEACSQTYKIKVPLWKFDRGFAGCRTRKKTAVDDVMMWMQNEMNENGITAGLRNKSAPVWSQLDKWLSTIADVEFGSFWPSTISESVSKGFNPEGRIFFGFMLCASLCLFTSDYTVVVKSVHLPRITVPILGLEFNTLRAWCPPIGLLLLSTVQMVPESEIFDIAQALMTLVHLVGAQFCFLVYLICELMALMDKDNVLEMFANEYWLRLFLLVLGGVAMGTFALTYGILTVGVTHATPYLYFPSLGYSDLYKYIIYKNEAQLQRPAEGLWKTLKMVSYYAEYIVASSILISHLVIWWFFMKVLDVEEKSLGQELSNSESEPDSS